MCEELLVEQCAPTMAGLKTGSLFSCPKEDRAELLRSIRSLNARLVPRGLRILPVKTVGDRELIYLYRPARLRRDLEDALATELLAERCYPAGGADRCVAELVRRLNRETDFPHEVGLFLGYPPQDVEGFIREHAREAKCVGAWKVYGDEEAAKRTFALYKRCTRACREDYHRHRSLERLIRPGA